MPALTVLFEDNHCLAFDKPAGMLMAGDQTGDLSLLDAAKDYLKHKYQKPGDVYLGLIHRLDRPVSGVALFARTSKAASRFSEQFRVGSTEKTYSAWVCGRPPASGLTAHDWLLKDEVRNVTSVVAEGTRGAQEAVLEFSVAAHAGNRTLLIVRPKTGRSHQIRVQLASRGWPILGDIKYGGPTAKVQGAIALHASQLKLSHPTLRTPLTVSAPIPDVWQDWFGVSSGS